MFLPLGAAVYAECLANGGPDASRTIRAPASCPATSCRQFCNVIRRRNPAHRARISGDLLGCGGADEQDPHPGKAQQAAESEFEQRDTSRVGESFEFPQSLPRLRGNLGGVS